MVSPRNRSHHGGAKSLRSGRLLGLQLFLKLDHQGVDLSVGGPGYGEHGRLDLHLDPAVGVLEFMLMHGLEEASSHALGGSFVAARQSDEEGIAAEAAHGVVGTHQGTDALAYGPENIVALVLAEHLVDLFEAFDVDQDQAERRVGTFGANQLLAEEAQHAFAIPQTGEAIVRGLAFDLGQDLTDLSAPLLGEEEEAEAGPRQQDGGDADAVDRAPDSVAAPVQGLEAALHMLAETVARAQHGDGGLPGGADALADILGIDHITQLLERLLQVLSRHQELGVADLARERVGDVDKFFEASPGEPVEGRGPGIPGRDFAARPAQVLKPVEADIEIFAQSVRFPQGRDAPKREEDRDEKQSHDGRFEVGGSRSGRRIGHNRPMITGTDLQALREELEDLDRDILELLKRRMQRVEDVARVKLEAAVPFRDHQREERVLQRVRGLAVERGLDPHSVERLYRRIMEMSIAHQQAHIHDLETVPLRVAYQGVEGSYSHLTSQRHYAGRKGGVLLTGYTSVAAVAEAVRYGKADVALLPIENSTAGTINATYEVLNQGDLKIIAEAISQVRHCLVTLPDTRLETLRKVYSHPQALAQCENFLRTVPWVTPVAEFDTAGAALKVKESGDSTLCAISSESAAKRFGLTVLRRGIQNQADNSTRFVEISLEASPCPSDVECKTSIMLVPDQDPVTLGEALGHFGRRGLRLTNLVSQPIPQETWKYRFYMDLAAHVDDQRVVEAFAEIQPMVTEFLMLGSYPRAEAAPIEGTSSGGPDHLKLLW